ncbi:hypothetical protein GIW81_15065 [Hyphomicrobium sp. xq]|uniref:PsiF repeat-containing protein n=1 Tax=Hyphomicrobium album TaxID=2665159 RepID=A0A6I3KMW8_9HYPH|nr:hypothetical protein [Hyphomicrobium album]MTD95658.1 hypothetical protein [Hyphomicrobium album]
MSRIAKASMIAIAGALLISATALADPGTSATANTPAGTTPTATTTTGSINLDPSPEQRMKDCMAIWDRGTHMTKQQWRRTCKTTLGEFMD